MKSHGSDFMMVSGDFNDRCLSWTDNHCNSDLGLKLLDLSNIYNLTQLINEPTRYINNRASVLDLIFVDNEHFVKQLFLLIHLYLIYIIAVFIVISNLK